MTPIFLFNDIQKGLNVRRNLRLYIVFWKRICTFQFFARFPCANISNPIGEEGAFSLQYFSYLETCILSFVSTALATDL